MTFSRTIGAVSLLGGLVLLGSGLALAQSARAAVQYHPVYLQRMSEQLARAAQEQGGTDGGQQHR